MAKFDIPKPIQGIDQLSDETSLIADAEGNVLVARELVNIDIDRQGNLSRRKGSTLQKSGSGYHSLYNSKRGWLFVCNKHQLGIYNPSTTTFTALANMNDSVLEKRKEVRRAKERHEAVGAVCTALEHRKSSLINLVT